MDRYTGLLEIDHDEAAPLLLKRLEWESDQLAIAEYESWHLDKLLMEDDAEQIAGQ